MSYKSKYTGEQVDDLLDKTKELEALAGAVDFSPTIAYENSEVINGQVSAYLGYQVTAPIFLNKGDTIALTSYSGGGTQAISLTDANGSFYTSIDATPGYKTRTYTAIEDCYVALSWLNIATYPRTITIESAYNIPNIINRIEALERGATPSGDPMHYAYEAVGAHWNDDTSYWEFYDMKDITNIEMSRALARGSWYIGGTAIGVLSAFNEQSLSAIRFNIARTGPTSVTCDFDYFADNKWIEFINLTFDNNLVSKPFTYASYLTGSFNGCTNLRRIYGEINVTNTQNEFTDTFTGCVKLEDVEIYGLNKNISFVDSPLLSKESLLYMIRNSVQGAEIIITLHPDVHWEATNGEWEEAITSAINDYGENILLSNGEDIA